MKSNRLMQPWAYATAFALLVFNQWAMAQNVGECIRLKASSQLGVPLHATAGDHVVSGRLGDSTVARIDAIDAATNWIHVTAGTGAGWIIRQYAGPVVPCEPVTPDPGPTPAVTEYVVGCWNLEHFDGVSSRGFPENTHGGPSYGPHSQADYETIASMIESMQAKLLILEEIGGKEVEDPETGDDVPRSDVLDRLVGVLGSNDYAYVIDRSGGPQRIAILYDKRAVRLNSVCEAAFPNIKVENKSVFDREPLLAHVTLLRDGQPMNDLEIVGVHLASGQQLTANHDKAMKTIVDYIAEQRANNACVPSGEMDVLIAGDFNASRFDTKVESFWNDMEHDGWDVLADNGATYPVSRLSGVPLKFDKSQIDYIIISAGPKGLKGEEVSVGTATVHQEFIGTSADNYRAHASDHVPVTVNIRIGPDND